VPFESTTSLSTSDSRIAATSNMDAAIERFFPLKERLAGNRGLLADSTYRNEMMQVLHEVRESTLVLGEEAERKYVLLLRDISSKCPAYIEKDSGASPLGRLNVLKWMREMCVEVSKYSHERANYVRLALSYRVEINIECDNPAGLIMLSEILRLAREGRQFAKLAIESPTSSGDPDKQAAFAYELDKYFQAILSDPEGFCEAFLSPLQNDC
jgi:hypothetical protein